MKKGYLAHPISTTGEFNDSIRVADMLEQTGVKFYAPAKNKSINDKSNKPTAKDIYDNNIDRLHESDLIVVNYAGGDSEGTLYELAYSAGRDGYEKQIDELYSKESEKLDEYTINRIKEYVNLPRVLVYSSNNRALQPQMHNGIASSKLNHMVLGGIDHHFKWCGDEDSVLKELERLSED